MLSFYSKSRARQMVADYSALIENICAPYQFPSAYLKAILLMEVPEINFLDIVADAIVRLNWLRYSFFHTFILERHTRNPLKKFDCSTGFAQIFAQVAIEAILFAESEQMPLFLGISGKLSPFSPEDLKRVWIRLNKDRVFNFSCAVLNIIHAAYQMTGRVDFESYSEEEKKMIFSRYNGNVQRISRYGETAYQYYLEYQRS